MNDIELKKALEAQPDDGMAAKIAAVFACARNKAENL